MSEGERRRGPAWARRPFRTLARYTLLQAPSWVFAAALLWFIVETGRLEPWLAWVLWALWVAHDFVLYPWLRHAYEASDPDPALALVGRTGEARERIDPTGYVRVGAELWRAQLAPGCAPIEAGDPVRIRSVRGLTVVVESDV